MEYTYDIPVILTTYVKTYVAEIRGPHDTFVFDRRFVERNKTRKDGKYHLSYNIGGHGVFEQSVKRFVINSDEEIDVQKQWFVYFQKQIIPIDKCNVLLAVEMMNSYYSNVRTMGDQLKVDMLRLSFLPQFDIVM